MKIITKIFGGLGNQMFQYACGKTVAQRLKAQLCLDLSWFYYGNRRFMLDVFPNIRYSVYHENQFVFKKILQRLGFKILYIKESNYSYWPGINDIKSSVILSGYWQNEKYFSEILTIIRQDFMFPEFDCPEAKNIAKKIEDAPCSISVHVRRGDYVEDPNTNHTHGICSLDYYKKAIQIVIDKNEKKTIPKLYIFSDDPAWVKNNFNTLGLPAIVVDIQEHKEKSYHDMHLMSLCQHHIIANSSFSWWGSWLSSRNGIVIAPRRWFADDILKDYNPSLVSWLRI
jgi:hypothetical protein